MNEERRWLVSASLIATATMFAFFLVAPYVGYPLEPNQAQRVLQLVLPTFIGYLALAVPHYFGDKEPAETLQPTRDRRLLVRGPVIVFGICYLLLIGVFWYSNRATGIPGMGMNIDTFAWFTSLLLAFLAAVTGLLAKKLFD